MGTSDREGFSWTTGCGRCQGSCEPHRSRDHHPRRTHDLPRHRRGGHLGALAIEALLDRGLAPAEIVATARHTDRLSTFAARGVTTRTLDYDDPASIYAALEGVRRLLLVSSSAVGQRVAQHRNVLEAAARNGVELVAYTSILRADSTSLALAAEHHATEQVLAELGLPHVLLRNAWYVENYTAQVPVHLEHGSVLGAAGAGRISAAARADYAEAAAVALLADDSVGKVHELRGGRAVHDGRVRRHARRALRPGRRLRRPAAG